MEQTIDQLKDTFINKIQEFDEIGQKFVNATISSAEFKASSGGMGVYAQRGGKEFMIRLRVLSGVLDFKTLNLINDFASEYSLEYIHLTTRQAIQIHDLAFHEVIGIMEKSLENELYTRGGGGNFPRNVSLSPLSGVEKDEAFDVTPYALLVNNYFLSKMNTFKLPRKFKVAFSNNSKDTANATVADLGFIAVIKDGKKYFRLFLGGGLGANGAIGIPYDELVDPADTLYHVEAMLSLFVAEGDYQNKGKARIRYILGRMGKEAFLDCYKKHLKHINESQVIDYQYKTDYEVNVIGQTSLKLEDVNVISQKQEGLYTVVLHPQGGLLKSIDLNNIVTYLKNISNAQVRLTMEESMLVRNLTALQAKELLQLTKELRNTTRLSRSLCCIGVPICQIGIGESQALLNSILTTFKEKEFTEDILPALHISGCLNSCSRHQVSELGLQGKKKRVNEAMEYVYALHLGGYVSAEGTTLAKEYGDLLATTIPSFLYELALVLKENKLELKDYIIVQKEEFETILEKYLV